MVLSTGLRRMAAATRGGVAHVPAPASTTSSCRAVPGFGSGVGHAGRRTLSPTCTGTGITTAATTTTHLPLHRAFTTTSLLPRITSSLLPPPSSTKPQTTTTTQQQSRHYTTPPPPRPPSSSPHSGGISNRETLLWMTGVLLTGSTLFLLLVQKRKSEPGTPTWEKMKADKAAYEASLKSTTPPPPTTTTTPITSKFSPKDVTVIFVLGGPGAGKGTQCTNLKTRHNFHHLSAGDLLRLEQARENSPYGELIRNYIRDGKIVPMEVTVALLSNAMEEIISSSSSSSPSSSSTPTKFLVDGFPRELAQAHFFEQTVCPGKLVLFFETSEDTMLKRLLKRGETSGREDDNLESIRKRFKTFVGQSMPVVEYYEGLGKVVRVDASRGVEEVFGDVEREFRGLKVLD